MAVISDFEALGKLRDVLYGIFDSEPEFGGEVDGINSIVRVLSFVFVIELKKSASGNTIRKGLDRLLRRSREGELKEIPLLVVPYMSDLGKQQCRNAKVSWLDLSGNANIHDRALVVRVEGRPNRFKERSRKKNPFAPKSSRLLRIMLSNPEGQHYQNDLAGQAELSKAMISLLITSLEKDGYVTRSRNRAITLVNPGLLLAEWKNRYSLSDHAIDKGHVYAGSGPDRIEQLRERLSQLGIEYAFTGLVAAWIHAPFSDFRLASVYIKRPLSKSEKEELRFETEPRGANTWLIVPKDKGVFWGARDERGVRIVSPLQTYLDLEGHPERSREAQVEIQSRFLKWSISAV